MVSETIKSEILQMRAKGQKPMAVLEALREKGRRVSIEEIRRVYYKKDDVGAPLEASSQKTPTDTIRAILQLESLPAQDRIDLALKVLS